MYLLSKSDMTRISWRYAFCEYRDVETALSAYRNLNNVEFMGRQLRVDWSAVHVVWAPSWILFCTNALQYSTSAQEA